MRKTVLIIVSVLIVCAVLVAFARSRDSAKVNAAAQKGQGRGQQAIPVAVAAAVRKNMPVYVSGLGSVQAFYTVTVKPRVDGQITQVYFKEGQDVKQGQLLAQIDPRPYQVVLSQAEANLYKDQAQLTIAKRNFERYQDLFKQGIVARQDYDAQQSAFGALQGTVKADQALVDSAKLNLTYCRITSPISGRVGLRQVDPGNMVHASDPNGILVITQVHPITALFTIPEDNLPQVIKAKHAHAKPLEVDVFNRDDQTKLATGVLTTINNLIDPTTGTVRLKAVFDNTEGLLWPNQFVNARLLLDVRKDVVTIPAPALQRGVRGAFVFIVGPDNTVQIRPVQIGVTAGNLIEVDSGLSAGDKVVTDGQDKLQAGSRVQPHPDTSVPASQTTTDVQVGM